MSYPSNLTVSQIPSMLEISLYAHYSLTGGPLIGRLAD